MKYAPPPGPPPTHYAPPRYAPPPGPPPPTALAPADPRPPLLPTPGPYALDLAALAARGWAPLDLAAAPALAAALARLLPAARAFFALPADAKAPWAAPAHAQASERGWSHIAGEKQLLTLRAAAHGPRGVAGPARAAWGAAAALLADVARALARSLGLAADAFAPAVDPCAALPAAAGAASASLLRVFRYERPARGAPRVVAAAHRDLGLLSLVVGHTPGLDVWDPAAGAWVAVEEGGAGGLRATVLVGQTLAVLARGRLAAGVHRVSVAAAAAPAGADGDADADEAFRYSAVFALRPAPVRLDTARLTSAQTGGWEEEAVDAGALFRAISAQAWNVNIGTGVREEQQRRLRAMKARLAEEAGEAQDGGQAVHGMA